MVIFNSYVKLPEGISYGVVLNRGACPLLSKGWSVYHLPDQKMVKIPHAETNPIKSIYRAKQSQYVAGGEMPWQKGKCWLLVKKTMGIRLPRRIPHPSPRKTPKPHGQGLCPRIGYPILSSKIQLVSFQLGTSKFIEKIGYPMKIATSRYPFRCVWK